MRRRSCNRIILDGKPFRDLSGKVAVVTGTSRGLGQYFGRGAWQAGADLVITSRDKSRLGEFKEEIESMGRRALPVKLDVGSESDIEAMVRTAINEYGKIDILVNNAGLNIRQGGRVHLERVGHRPEHQPQGRVLRRPGRRQGDDEAAVRPDRQYRLVHLRLRHGRHWTLLASRGGILQMSRSLAAEWGKHGITVNVLAPAGSRPPKTRASYDNAKWVEYIVGRIPLGRPGQPNDLDGTGRFLASDASAYITGQILLVDGGFTTCATKADPVGGTRRKTNWRLQKRPNRR